MNWHHYQNRGDLTELENVSLIVAFANLLKKMERDIDPLLLKEALLGEGESDLDWASLTAYDSQVMPTSIGSDIGSWPTSPLSIIQFRYISSDGETVDHYCTVANPANHTIIDSLNGHTTYSGSYGEPVSWASYAIVEMDEEEAEPEIVHEDQINVTVVPKVRTGVLHKVLSGENIWRIAQQYKIPVDDIMSHNEITEYKDVQPGMVLYLPLQNAQKDRMPISYEVLSHPRPMHVSHAGGAKKWSFGNVTTWKDIREGNSQLYPQNHNLMIVAIAHVPVEDDIAAYYMDANAFGDYKTTGLVRYMLGFNWQHLADGHVANYVALEEPEPTPTDPEELESAIRAELDIPEEETPAVEEVDFKESYFALPDGPVMYSAKETIKVYDLEDIQEPRLLNANRLVKVAGTFEKNGVTYGLPIGAIKGNEFKFWYGVPMSNLDPEDALYSDPTRNEKIIYKKANRQPLALDEKLTDLVGKYAGKIEEIRFRFKNKQRSK